MATLENKSILIIGGSSGMGYAVAEASLKSLARSVIIASSNKARVDSAVKRLTEGEFGSPGKVKGFVVDAGSEESVKELFENLRHHSDPGLTSGNADDPGVDHVVFTSGGPGERFVFPNVDIKAAKEAMDLRVWGAVAVAKYAKIRPGGSITFTSGTFAIKPSAAFAISAAANGGLHSLAKGLAIDLAPIRVNVICPGAVMTELWDQLPQAVREGVIATIPPKLLVKHIGTPEEVAEAYLFCMKCDYITGQIIVVDGGHLLG